MEITLLRHGKPEDLSLHRLSASEFCGWIQDYNASSLSESSKPTEAAFDYVSRCNAIICSELTRSIDSAKILNKEKIILSDSIFNEAGLPFTNWQKLKLSPKIWAVLFRVLWLFGFSRNSESFKEAKNRAKEAVRKLSQLSNEYDTVLFVGHGVFNRILAKELRKSGWSGPKNPGSKYWSFGIYKLKET